LRKIFHKKLKLQKIIQKIWSTKVEKKKLQKDEITQKGKGRQK